LSKRKSISTSDQHTKTELEDLQKELYDLSARNPFINISLKKLWFLGDDLDHGSMAKKLYSKALFYRKEYALDTTLKVEVFIKWRAPNRDSYFTSPLFYRTAKIILNRKIETNYSLRDVSEELFVNPILRHCFKQYFDFDFPIIVDFPDALTEKLIHEFSNQNSEIRSISQFDDEEEWQLINILAVGNFNYKKSLLGADFDHIKNEPNRQIENILIGSKRQLLNDFEIPDFINQLDATQKQAIEKALVNDLVIQGPPGTGKSHTIVSLIGTYLMQGKKVLFVSEKRSALDVVFERLKSQDIHYWAAYFNTEKDEKKGFYAHLKKAWEKATAVNIERPTGARKIEIKNEIFSLYPKKILAQNEALGTNLNELINILHKAKLPIVELSAKGTHPKFSEWTEHFDFLTELESKMIKGIGVGRLTQAGFVQLNKSLFREKEPVVLVEKKLEKIEKTLSEIQIIQSKYSLNLSLDEFTKYAITASVLAMVNKSQLNLLHPETSEYKSFRNWAKKVRYSSK